MGLPGTPNQAPKGKQSHGLSTPGANPQSDADHAFKGKQADITAKGPPKSEKVAKMSAMKRRINLTTPA